jgi:hypothetical protein
MEFNKNDIAVIILSCDKFKVTWKPCIDHFFNVWPACPFPVYLLNNFIESDDKRVINLLVGDDITWSETLKKALLKIPQNRVFFIFDDSFIAKIDLNRVMLVFKTAIDNDLTSVALKRNPFGRGVKYNDYIYRLNSNTKYRNSLFLNLIKKKCLFELLKPDENAWEFEKKGNNRSKKFDFYSVYEPNLTIYHHGIVKGKWLPSTLNYLIKKGYLLEDNTFSSYSSLQVFAMNLYSLLFFSINKVLHQIKN